jgi:hypothetical protein
MAELHPWAYLPESFAAQRLRLQNFSLHTLPLVASKETVYLWAQNAIILWSGIFCSPSLTKFHDPASPVLVATKTWLRLAHVHKNGTQVPFSVMCAHLDLNQGPSP